MRFLLNYFVNRLKEPSTWRGITMLATGAGVAIQPELLPMIVAVGTSAAGAIGIVTKEVE